MTNNSPWQTLSSKTAYKTPYIEIQEDAIILPNGEEGIYSIVKKADASFLIPVDDDGSIYFLKEFRYAIGKEILNIPAGSLKPTQTPKEAAKDELKEETGLTAGNIELLGQHYISPGHSDIKHYIFLMTKLKGQPKTTNIEGDEGILEVVKIPSNKVKRMILDGKIEDGSTLAALCFYFLKK